MTTSSMPAAFGPYRVVRLVGAGGLGEVYEVEREGTPGRLALKTVKDALDVDLQLRFRREVEVLRSLSDPNLVPLVDADVDASPPYLVMPLLQGTSLGERLEEPTPQEAVDWLTAIARGLACAHRAGILHRDLKPANVILTVDGGAVLIDFGLARIESSAVTPLTESGDILGTLSYLPPEIFQGQKFTTRSDVYQWGLLAYMLGVGTLPYADQDQMAAVQRRCAGVDTAGLARTSVGRIAPLIARCLAVDPAQRPRHGGELVEALRAALEPTAAPPVPAATLTRVGPYEIVRLLGRGGMGAVYEAREPRSGARVAVKLVHPQLAAHRSVLERFEREGKLLVSLFSPRIVQVLDVGREESTPWIAMEYLHGRTLEGRLAEEGALALAPALTVLTQMAEGLAELHARSIVHRDLKPANVFLPSQGGLKILDLGLALPLEDLRLTATGHRVGTPLYASPEQLAGTDVGPASDVFQVGLIMFELLTNRRDARTPTAASLLRGLLGEDPRLRERPAAVETVVSLFARSLEREPARRPANGAALLAALRQIEASTTARSRPVRAPTPPPVAPPAAPSPAPRSLFRRALDVALALLVVAVTGLIIWFLPELVRRLGDR